MKTLSMPKPYLFLLLSSLLILYGIISQATTNNMDQKVQEPQDDVKVLHPKKVLPETQTAKDTVKLLIPKQAIAGTEIDLKWTFKTSFIGLIQVKQQDKDIIISETPAYIRQGGSYRLRMPSNSGTVQIRISKQGTLLAHQEIQLLQANIRINAVKESIVGEILKLKWKAPKGLDGFINIQALDTDANFYAQPHVDTHKKKTAKIQLPSTTGDYILRWYNRHDRQVLAEYTIKLISSEVRILAPDKAMTGEELQLTWQAPKGLDAFINIQAANAEADYNATPYVYITDKTQASLQLPTEAGRYVLRWYDRSSHEIVTEHPISLTGSAIRIHAPEEAIAGSEVELTWQAPKDLDSFINIQLAAAAADYNATPYIYTTKKQKGVMKMPDRTGKYILRWYNRTDHEMLAEQTITLISTRTEN